MFHHGIYGYEATQTNYRNSTHNREYHYYSDSIIFTIAQVRAFLNIYNIGYLMSF